MAIKMMMPMKSNPDGALQGTEVGKNEKKIVTGYSESIRTITAGMRHNGLTRIMVMGSWYNEDNGVNSGSGISGNDFINCHF